MRLTIDTDARTLTVEDGGAVQTHDLYTPEAFAAISRHWLRVGFSQKYVYRFSWLGRPVIQLPEDLVRIQETIALVQPDAIVETGVAHGGSLIFHATVCHALGRGRVIGVDVHIRPHNRAAIESHRLRPYITLLEGSSIDPAVFGTVKSLIADGERVLVILDSDHSYRHVSEELRLYSELVRPGSYVVVADGLPHDLWDVPQGRPEWREANAAQAAIDFVAGHPEFTIEPPAWPFNESALTEGPTYFHAGWLRRRDGDEAAPLHPEGTDAGP
jgi:cephalosporin hydroxylase